MLHIIKYIIYDIYYFQKVILYYYIILVWPKEV